MISTGQQVGAGGGTQRRAVEVGQHAAIAGELINVGRADLAAKGAQVGVAEVIGENDNDVGLAGDAPGGAAG